MNKVQLVLGADGAGGLCMGFPLAHFIKQAGYSVEVILSIKDAGFKALNSLFNNLFSIRQVPEEYSHNHRILFDAELQQRAGLENEWYYFCPDLVFSHPRSFDFNKFCTTPQTVKSTRLLTDHLRPEGIIYLALNTTTLGYQYAFRKELIFQLAKTFPNDRIYLPVIDQWAEQSINNNDLNEEFPYNVLVDKNPDIIVAIEYLMRSRLCICLDNGFSHISYQLGQQRILLDPHLPPIDNNSVKHAVRWRETFEDSVRLNTHWQDVVDLVSVLTTNPQISLLPKDLVVRSLACHWPSVLGFKL